MTNDENKLDKKQNLIADPQEIKLTQVQYFENYNGQVLAFIHKNKCISGFSCSLDNLESALSELGFHRINQKQIVNIHCVMEKKNKSRSIVLVDGARLKVSRKCWYKIKDFMAKT
jgi:DNA-binding LytR/AlgR family response regulator